MGWSSIALIAYIIIVGITAIILVFSMFNIKKSQTGLPDLVREEAYLARIMLAPDCLAHEDPTTGRPEGGVIDWRLLETNDAFRACYPAEEADWQLQVTVERASGSYLTVRSEYYRPAGIASSIIKRPVIVRDGNAVEPGILTLFVQP